MLNWFSRLLWIAAAVLIVVMPGAAGYAEEERAGDWLVYASGDYDEFVTYYLYNPQTGVHRSFFTDYSQTAYFSVSVDGRLAFASERGNLPDIFVMDTVFGDSSAITNIMQSPTTIEYPLGWSHDGHYLAYSSYEPGYKRLYVWDGATAVDITPEGKNNIDEVTWSLDGRLAFEAWHDTRSTGGEKTPTEIFLWDGQSITNLSQRPTAESGYPAWSNQGELAFYSRQDGVYEISIWDGMSLRNGAPDRDTFTTIAPDVVVINHNLSWTNTGDLAFSGRQPQDETSHIYVWDGQTITNLSQLPASESYLPRWSASGLWNFVVLPEYEVHVRDETNRAVFTDRVIFLAVWGPNDYLTFCRGESGSQLLDLRLWNGQDVIDVTRARAIWAQWVGGARMNCSLG